MDDALKTSLHYANLYFQISEFVIFYFLCVLIMEIFWCLILSGSNLIVFEAYVKKKHVKRSLFRLPITLTRKNMNLPYSIRMYWTNFWQAAIHVQQNIFEKNLLEVGSSHIYASFGTFCVQIDQLFEAQWVSEKCMKTVKLLF